MAEVQRARAERIGTKRPAAADAPPRAKRARAVKLGTTAAASAAASQLVWQLSSPFVRCASAAAATAALAAGVAAAQPRSIQDFLSVLSLSLSLSPSLSEDINWKGGREEGPRGVGRGRGRRVDGRSGLMRLSGVGGSSSRGRPLRRKLHPLSAAATVAAAAVARRRHPSYHSPLPSASERATAHSPKTTC